MLTRKEARNLKNALWRLLEGVPWPFLDDKSALSEVNRLYSVSLCTETDFKLSDEDVQKIMKVAVDAVIKGKPEEA